MQEEAGDGFITVQGSPFISHTMLRCSCWTGDTVAAVRGSVFEAP